MSRNINDIYNFIDYVCRKERGSFISITEAMAALDAGQLNLEEDYFKQYGKNQTIHDAIRVFSSYYQFTSDSSGFVTFPADYLHLIGSPFTVTGSTVNEITFCNEDEWVAALKSQLRPVSLSRPLGKDTSTGFSLYPQSTQIGFLTYIKRPPTPVLGVTQVGRVITYNPATSTQLSWEDAYINAVIGKALGIIGINLDDEGIIKFAQQFNAESE